MRAIFIPKKQTKNTGCFTPEKQGRSHKKKEKKEAKRESARCGPTPEDGLVKHTSCDRQVSGVSFKTPYFLQLALGSGVPRLFPLEIVAVKWEKSGCVVGRHSFLASWRVSFGCSS